MDADEEDFVFFGTPIEREEDTSARKRKAVADAGQLRALPAWKQEVRDEEGRRRFHGAFTGGFSAGYYNTVGTKEGWTPQTFTSSRKNRADVKKQSIYNFLDDEDIKDMGGQALETSMKFDTFGFTAAEFARKQAEKEQQKRPSAIPGPAPDEIILPASNSIGVKLLLKMGWRHGHSIKDKHADSIYEARREARKALMAFSGNEDAAGLTQNESTMIDSEKASERLNDPLYASKSVPIFLLQPKQDLFGLGYDPYKHAPEFRDNKRRHESTSKGSYKSNFPKQGSILDSKSRKYAPGFGIGALEELDIEDEDIYASGFEFEQTEVEDVEPSREINYDKKRIEEKRSMCLPGFKVASNADYQLERFHPPVVPADFKPQHKFPTGRETAVKIDGVPPPEVPPPEDNDLKVLINGFATLVARCGKVFEDLSKEKNRDNPLFSFLTGGNGCEYYERKLWEEKQQNTTQVRMSGNSKSKPSDRIMMAENRGRLLGEKPLQRSIKEADSPVSVKEVHFQSNLSDTFTKSVSLVQLLESAKPFEKDPAKQERFEQFLKDKYQGGLRRTEASSGNTLSEVDRARERLDFEATAEAIEKGARKTDMGPPSNQQVLDIIGSRDQHFISPAGPEKHEDPQTEDNKNKFYLRREEFQWRPSPLLCKRFDILDPFMGKPPPLPRPKSRMDSLFFVPDPTKDLKIERPDVHRGSESHSKVEAEKESNNHKEQETEEARIDLQRPVDLYKAIFSDDSDEEEEQANTIPAAEPIKKSEGANTTLNRLVAGDFLESLGKELGLEVPPDTNYRKHDSSTTLIETVDARDVPTENNETSTVKLEKLLDNDELSDKQNVQYARSRSPIETFKAESSNLRDGHDHHKNLNSDLDRSKSGYGDMVFSFKDNKSKKIHQRNDGAGSRHHKHKSYSDSDSFSDRHRSERRGQSRRQQSRSRTPESSSSGDKHQAKKSRGKSRHRHRRSEDSDSSDSQEHGRSKSTSKKRTSHGTSERHSRRHKHRRVRSSSTYSSDDETRIGGHDRVKEKRSRDRRKHSVDSDSVLRKKQSRQD